MKVRDLLPKEKHTKTLDHFYGSHGFILKAHAQGLAPNYWKGENYS